MTQDEIIIKSFCKKAKINLKKIDCYEWEKNGYVVNSEGRIEVLNLHSLEIKNIPEYIAELSELKILHLADNELKSIKEIGNLTKLEILVIQDNNITDISVIERFKELKEFNAQNNSIVDTTPLKYLKHIKYIDLSNNPLISLQSLLNLDIYFILDFEHRNNLRNEVLINNCNRIKSPPIEIVRQGDEAIRRYFGKIEEEGLDYIYEAKLILVGQGDSGKTSLQKRLLDENAELPKKEERTRGIEVADFEFKKGKIAHIWDFGGQVIYYPVHRFFITENSVFILLASTRHSTHNFEYWLPTIFQFGGKSPVIIGQTCHDGNTVQWNDLNIYLGNSYFNIIKTLTEPYYQIDLPNNNKGLDTIKECITSQINGLHHFGKSVPTSWSTVRNTLLEKSKSDSYISFQSFTDLCKELEPDRFKNKEDIEDCCNFLHNIGVILWYSKTEELKSWVILKPEWAMSAVYQIIDDNDIQNNNGHIRPDDFTRLWDDKSDEEHSILKKMLETFKIAFPTKHFQGQYILPARLISIPPEKKWKPEKNVLRLEYNFEFMPKGIINQISAELSRYIQDNEVWNNAVNFTLNDSKSQIIEDSYHRKLAITSKGIDARGLNVLVMNAIKNVIEGYKGVKAEINVICNCKICQQSEKPTFFPYDKLVEWSKKRGHVTCYDGNINWVISKLLYTVGFDKKGTQPPIKKISIFLASSEELIDDREKFEIFIYRETKELISKGIFIELVIWEDFIDSISQTRLQDEYNKAAINSDIFISLFWTKVGKYTKEEFSQAYIHFSEKGKPYVYTYFKNAEIKPKDIRQDDINSLLDFKQELKKIGHFPSNYENIDNLKNQFKMQLQKILPNFT